MSKIKVFKTKIPGLHIIQPTMFSDNRGTFLSLIIEKNVWLMV